MLVKVTVLCDIILGGGPSFGINVGEEKYNLSWNTNTILTFLTFLTVMLDSLLWCANINDYTTSASPVRRHKGEPALRAVQVGHPAGGNRVHGGGNDDVCRAAGKVDPTLDALSAAEMGTMMMMMMARRSEWR